MSSHLHSCARRLAFAALTLLVLLVSQFATVHTAQGQWSIGMNVGQANFVKMMDEIGKPDIGYIGSAKGGLLRTTNKGVTWARVTNTSVEQIYDIAFKNAQVGICVGQIYTYKTTDGGLSWAPLGTVQGRAIHYITSTNMFVIASWSMAAQASTDEGATWQAFSGFEMNGFAYLDANRVLFTPHQSQARYTTDGGVSWETSNMSAEIYQPTAIRSRGWYIGVSEFNGAVWRSKDGGYVWEYLTSIMNPTGCMRGTDNNLIVQTRSGMLRSTDFGEHWEDICGPDLTYDTRFWVRGLEIFAVSEDGNFYYNPTSSPIDDKFWIYVSPPNHLYSDGCSPALGEIRVSTNACNVQLTQVTIEGDNELSLNNPTVPSDLKSSTFIPIKYLPVDGDDDSAIVKIRLTSGDLIIDTFVKIYGHIQTMINPAVSPSTVSLSMSPIDCKIDQETVQIQNLGCDAYTIDSMRLSDPLHFSVTPLTFPATVASLSAVAVTVSSHAVNVKKAFGTLFVYVSNPAGRVTLEVALELNRIGSPLKPMSDRRFVFNTTCDPKTSSIDFTNYSCDTVIVDSVQLASPTFFKLQTMSLPKALIKDQSMTIPFDIIAPRPGPASTRVIVHMRTLGVPTQQVAYLFSSTVVQVVLPADTVKFVAGGTCPEFDSTFHVRNILCDPIRILQLKPAFSNDFKFTLPTLPVELGTDGEAEIGVSVNTFFKGFMRTQMFLQYEAYGKVYDTLIYISVRSQRSFTIDPKISKLNFGRISVCAPQTRTVYVENHYCLPVTIDRVRLATTSSNRFSILYQPLPSRLLQPGERDSVVLQFAPDVLGVKTGAVEVRLKSAVVTLDTFFTVEGIGTGSVNANIRDEQLDLGTALTCQHLEQTTVVRNDGCVDLDITSVQNTSGKFELATPSLPYKLAPGDSVTLTFELATTQVGLHDQTVRVRMLSPQGIEQLLDCKLTAMLNVEQPRFIVPPLTLGSLNACKPFDTTIMVRNPLLCDPIEMSAAFTSANATIVGPSTAIIPPGRFFVFAIRIQPDASGTVDLHLRATSIDTTIAIPYIFTGGGGGGMTLSGPTRVLKTNACDAIYDTVFVTVGECDAQFVDDIRLMPVGGTATRFSLVENYTFPRSISVIEKNPIPIRFDPKASGVNSARLEVLSNGVYRTFDLNADFVPVGSISAAITSAGLKQIVVGDEFDVDLELNAAMPQSTAINDISAAFSYDGDLITLVNVTPLGEWTLLDQETESGEAELRLSHPASSFGLNFPVARLRFKTAIAKEKSGTVKLEGIVINEGDPRFEDCVAHTIFHESSNDVAVTYFCGGETLRGALDGKLPISNIVVQPHPASASARHITVNFDMAAESKVDVELINVLGSTLSTSSINATTGHNEVQLPLNGTSKGWHLLRLKTAFGVAGIRVLISD